MSEYTPTTDQVRVAYQDHRDFQAAVRDLDRPGDVEAGREFDRWFARVQRDAAKAAWDEAIEEALDGWTIPASGNIKALRFILLSINPYMPEETP